MMQRMLAVMMAMIGLAMMGCCVKPPLPPLPPAISLEQQMGLLNARARATPKMTVGGTLVIRYKDDHGDQQQSVDGRLLFEQHYGEEAKRDSGDVYLEGHAFNQTAFAAGKNQDKWWFMIKGDTMKSWVGDVAASSGGADAAATDRGSGGILRADLVLQALAVTEIVPQPDETVAMIVDDDSRSNQILIVKKSPAQAGTGWVKRMIVVDRDSGDVRRVDMYDAAGVCIVRSELSDYRAVGHREGDDVPADFKGPRFPHDIWITYRAAESSIHLTITGEPGKKAELWDHLREAVFKTPSFEGYRLIEN